MPVISNIVSQEVDCSTTNLIATVENLGLSKLNYWWSTTDGKIISSDYLDRITVNKKGTYTLKVNLQSTDFQQSCVVTKSFTLDKIKSEIEIPTIKPLPLTCNRLKVTLDASSASTGTNYSYLWTTLNGEIVTKATLKTIDVTKPGIYKFTVYNSNTQCSESVDINVTTFIVSAPTGKKKYYANGANTLANINITGENIKWYDGANSTNELPKETILKINQKYYASQTIDGCESINRFEVVGSLELFSEDFGSGTIATNEMPNGATTEFGFLGRGNFNPAVSTIPINDCPINYGPRDGEYLILSAANNNYYSTKDFCFAKNNLSYPGWYQNFEDHTPNDISGKYMVVNGYGAVNGTVYMKTITGLSINTTYSFSAYIMNILNKSALSCSQSSTDMRTEKPLNIEIAIYNGVNLTETPLKVIKTKDIIGFNSMAPLLGSDITPEQLANLWQELTTDFKAVSGNITIIMKDLAEFGCGNDFAIDDIYIKPVDGTLSTSNYSSNQIGFSPNPVNDFLTINNQEIIDRIVIYAYTGQKILENSYNTSEVNVDLSSLTNGNYIVKVISNNTSEILKIIKE